MQSADKRTPEPLTATHYYLQQVDKLDSTLQQLTHERDLLQRGMQAPTAANDKPLQSASGSAKVSSQLHALEARIQLKRAERAERKRALETDFAAVFKEVGMCSIVCTVCKV
jgi:hypothetical protein